MLGIRLGQSVGDMLGSDVGARLGEALGQMVGFKLPSLSTVKPSSVRIALKAISNGC